MNEQSRDAQRSAGCGQKAMTAVGQAQPEPNADIAMTDHLTDHLKPPKWCQVVERSPDTQSQCHRMYLDLVFILISCACLRMEDTTVTCSSSQEQMLMTICTAAPPAAACSPLQNGCRSKLSVRMAACAWPDQNPALKEDHWPKACTVQAKTLYAVRAVRVLF